MTANAIIFDPSRPDQIEYLNIENMDPAQCINVNVSQAGICQWFQNNGGIHPLPIANISALIAAYLGYRDLGFSMTGHSSYISGAIAYYLFPAVPSIGNNLTGCGFT